MSKSTKEQEELAELARLLGCQWVEHSNLHKGKAKYFFNGAYITEEALQAISKLRV